MDVNSVGAAEGDESARCSLALVLMEEGGMRALVLVRDRVMMTL